MNATELADKMSKRPLFIVLKQADRIKVSYLLNLLGYAAIDFTDEQLVNARDALVYPESRAFINDLLGISNRVEYRTDLAPKTEPTVMPMWLQEDESAYTQRRLVAFLRPDPKMTIEVEKKIVDTEPQLVVYQVTIEDGRGGLWREAFGSEVELQSFLRGIRATYAMSDLQKLLPDLGDNAPVVFTEQSAVNQFP